jgi:hypothetical protein
MPDSKVFVSDRLFAKILSMKLILLSLALALNTFAADNIKVFFSPKAR